jgi:hypothetical protein
MGAVRPVIIGSVAKFSRLNNFHLEYASNQLALPAPVLDPAASS